MSHKIKIRTHNKLMMGSRWYLFLPLCTSESCNWFVCLFFPPLLITPAASYFTLDYFTPQWKQSPWKASAVSGKKKKNVDCIFCQLVCFHHMWCSVILFVSCSLEMPYPAAVIQLGIAVALWWRLEPLWTVINYVLHYKKPTRLL